MEPITQHQPEVVDLTCSESLPSQSSSASGDDERFSSGLAEASARVIVYFKQYFELFCEFYQAARADGVSEKNSDPGMEEMVTDWIYQVIDKDLRCEE